MKVRILLILSMMIFPRGILRCMPVARTLPAFPLSFEMNCGQTSDQVRFLSRGTSYTLYLAPTEAVFVGALEENTSGPPPRLFDTPGVRHPRGLATTLTMSLEGADKDAASSGLLLLPGRSNYFPGNDQTTWRADIKNYAKAMFRQIYPGIDLVYYGNQSRLEYDFIAHPGADPGRIRISFKGSELNWDRTGNLSFKFGGGDLKLHAPRVYQVAGGRRREIKASFSPAGPQTVALRLGNYDRRKALVIDPVISYCTHLGGNKQELIYGMRTDPAGNLYLTGWTESYDFPLSNAYQDQNYRNGVCFITKINPGGSALIYSTFLGVSTGLISRNNAWAIAVDGAGSAYVTGEPGGSNFPVKNAFQPAPAGAYDAFVVKLSPAGNALEYSSFLGGSGDDRSTGIAVDNSGSAIVVGNTSSANFPLFHPFRSQFQSGEAFITKVNPSGSALVYSSYFGGNAGDTVSGVAVDSSGNIYAAGETRSTDFPLVRPLRSEMKGSEAWVARLNPGGSRLDYSTFLGGGGDDGAGSIVVDSSDNAIVLGGTSSSDFITKNAAAASGGNFMSKLNGDGSALVFSTYLPVSAGSIAVDAAGNLYTVGSAFSGLTLKDPIQNNAGGSDACIASYDPFGVLLFASYLGGNSNDYGHRIAAGNPRIAYVGGFTNSTNFPFTAGAFQTDYNPTDGGNGDAFVARIDLNGSGPGSFSTATPVPTSAATPLPGSTATYTPRAGSTVTFTPPPGSTPTHTPPPGSTPSHTPIPGPFSTATPVSTLLPTPGSPAPAGSRHVLAPCPARSGETIRLLALGNSPACTSSWHVFNSAGSLVSTVSFSADGAVFSTEGLAPGIYHAWIKTSCADGSTEEFRQKLVLTP